MHAPGEMVGDRVRARARAHIILTSSLAAPQRSVRHTRVGEMHAPSGWDACTRNARCVLTHEVTHEVTHEAALSLVGPIASHPTLEVGEGSAQ